MRRLRGLVDGIAIAAEIAAPGIEVGRWKGGGDVLVIVSGAGAVSDKKLLAIRIVW